MVDFASDDDLIGLFQKPESPPQKASELKKPEVKSPQPSEAEKSPPKQQTSPNKRGKKKKGRSRAQKSAASNAKDTEEDDNQEDGPTEAPSAQTNVQSEETEATKPEVITSEQAVPLQTDTETDQSDKGAGDPSTNETKAAIPDQTQEGLQTMPSNDPVHVKPDQVGRSDDSVQSDDMLKQSDQSKSEPLAVDQSEEVSEKATVEAEQVPGPEVRLSSEQEDGDTANSQRDEEINVLERLSHAGEKKVRTMFLSHLPTSEQVYCTTPPLLHIFPNGVFTPSMGVAPSLFLISGSCPLTVSSRCSQHQEAAGGHGDRGAAVLSALWLKLLPSVSARCQVSLPSLLSWVGRVRVAE